MTTEFDIYANKILEHICDNMDNTLFSQNVRKSLLLLAIYEEFRRANAYIWKNGEITDKEAHYANFLYYTIKNWQH